MEKGALWVNPGQNLLLEDVQYKVDNTRFGTWRRYLYPTGAYFAEFRSHGTFLGLPMYHYTRGVCPETGKRVVAKGVVAVGRLAVGIVAIGHVSAGLIAVGQLAVGLIFGLGQACTGALAIGQLSVGVLFGVGQIATGVIAIGQLGAGEYVLAQMGYGEHVWSPEASDPHAVTFFEDLWVKISMWFKGG